MYPEEPRPRGLVPGGSDVWSSWASVVTKKNHEEQKGAQRGQRPGRGMGVQRVDGPERRGRRGLEGQAPRSHITRHWQSLAEAVSAFGALHRPVR